MAAKRLALVCDCVGGQKNKHTASLPSLSLRGPSFHVCAPFYIFAPPSHLLIHVPLLHQLIRWWLIMYCLRLLMALRRRAVEDRATDVVG